MRARRVLVAALVLVLMTGSSVIAHERVTLDGDDSAGPLDIVAARWRHGPTHFKLRVVTYEQWPDSLLSSELNYVRFDIDRPHRAGLERCIVIHLYPAADEGPTAVDGSVYKNCDAPLPYRNKIGTVDLVTRPDSHSVRVSVKKRILWRTNPEHVRFRALTSYEDESHPECRPPDPRPPEHFLGTCSDETRWRKH